MEGQCTICGEIFKNLGSHMSHAHKKTDSILIVETEKIAKDKLFQDLILDMKILLKPFHHEMMIKVEEKDGTVTNLELIMRIQAKGYAHGR